MRKVELPHVIAFRIDAETKSTLEGVADAYGLKPADFARRALLEAIALTANAPPVARRVMHGEELRRLLGELGRQGSNLNQIAHHLNAGGRQSELTEEFAQLRRDHAAALREVTKFIVGATE